MGTDLLYKTCMLILMLLITTCSKTSGYSHYYIDMDKLCSYDFKTKAIEIGRDERSGILVEDLTYFNTLSGKYPFSCKFRVESISAMGIFAVIQNMRLRRNKVTGECIDYVQFRHSDTFQFGIMGIDLAWKTSNLTWGDKHCGNMDAKELDLSEIDPTDGNNKVPHAFIDSKGKMEVKIYVANETVDPDDKLNLKIAFTAFQICNHNMGNYKKCGADGCIWHQYFNDGIINCPFISCTDEGGCNIFYDPTGAKSATGLATKVLVGAVAGVFTMFVVFVAFIWLFRHCGFCWSNPSGTMTRPSPMIPVSTVNPDVRPTAPPHSPSLDKDLPPSYESLFPTSEVVI